MISQETESALREFQDQYPRFVDPEGLDALRTTDYARLDQQGHVYLDYTGGGLYAQSQLRQHMTLLQDSVLGNPHSQNPTSLLMTELVEQTRAHILTYFNASADEYDVIFTPNASGALKLVGEAYPFGPDGQYALTYDNHNSVNGIREFARAKGAAVTYIPLTRPDLRIDIDYLTTVIKQPPTGQSGPKLLAFPAQSNFSGVQHPLTLIEVAHAHGWDVLLDCAAFAPTNRLDLHQWQPDFVPLSFYKIFGYPTGIGCLLARKSALRKLQRPWFAGGTISITSVQGAGWHFLIDGAAGFEDGTVNYLNIPAVSIGLNHIAGIGIDTIHERVTALTGWLLDHLLALRHSNGTPQVRIFGPTDLIARGGSIAFTLHDDQGESFDHRRVELLAGRVNISLRTGCFCNPGAGEIAHELSRDEMAPYFRGDPLSFDQFFEQARSQGKSPSTIRISVGLASNFADIYRFLAFVQTFRDQSAQMINALPIQTSEHATLRDAA